jgi:hypothetical protein
MEHVRMPPAVYARSKAFPTRGLEDGGRSEDELAIARTVVARDESPFQRRAMSLGQHAISAPPEG